MTLEGRPDHASTSSDVLPFLFCSRLSDVYFLLQFEAHGDIAEVKMFLIQLFLVLT